LVGVEIGRGQELDGVDVGIVEELSVLAVDAWAQPPLPGPERRARLLGIAEGDHVAARMLEIAGRVELADVAAAHDGEADAIHGRASASPSSRPPRPPGERRREGPRTRRRGNPWPWPRCAGSLPEERGRP